jgi:hypothetical protein
LYGDHAVVERPGSHDWQELAELTVPAATHVWSIKQ